MEIDWPIQTDQIERGADLWVVDEGGQQALDHAEATFNVHIVERLRAAMRANPKVEIEDTDLEKAAAKGAK